MISHPMTIVIILQGIYNLSCSLLGIYPFTHQPCYDYTECNILPNVDLRNFLPDISYAPVSNDTGILGFNFYAVQHLENDPLAAHFLPHLIAFDSDTLINTYGHNPQYIKDLIEIYNGQKTLAVRDSNDTLRSIVGSIIQRSESELNVNLLKLHNEEEWYNVYIDFLKRNNIKVKETTYSLYFDNETNLHYLADRGNHDTFQFALNELRKADIILTQRAANNQIYHTAIIEGLSRTPESLLTKHEGLFRAAFHFEREIERLNKIDINIFK